MKKWTREKSEHQGNFRIFSVRKDFRRSPDSGKSGDFFVMECPDWVNVVALTEGLELILVEQYRQGADIITLELPGGSVDKEDPALAAERELLEETGFSASRFQKLGSVHPNPAIQNNLCHLYLCEGATRVQAQRLDPLEEINIVTVPLNEIPRLISDSKITHALTVCGLYLYHSQRISGKAPEFRT